MNNIQSSKHTAVRSFLRIAGPIVALVGLSFLAVGMTSFFSSFGSFEPPRFFWCGFVGMPLLFVGVVLCKFGYFGAVARYIAAEAAPVAKDTVNYMAEGTKDAVKTVARAVAEGVQEAPVSQKQK
ncbi:MAG: hypothetical protein HYY23_12670 [Verrucomicrobia bacterium]|nr:hypothetical protein [Verrucomicrobiota bacterium]